MAQKTATKPLPFPKWITPQLATLVEKPPQGDEWIHEIKYDGYRILSYYDGDSVRLLTRNNLDWSKKFTTVSNAVTSLSVKNVILDGEVCVLNKEGHSSFKLLQQSLKSLTKIPLTYYVFDLLYLNDINLTTLPLLQRKKKLKQLLKNTSPSLQTVSYIEGMGETVYANACTSHWEGIVSKLGSATYNEGRSKNWVKSKCINEEEFLIIGYTPYSALPHHIGALLLGQWNDKTLNFYGKVGTGFSVSERKEIFNKLKKLPEVKSPLKKLSSDLKNAVWVKPELVAQISFTERTATGSLRHPSFLGLRFDKPAAEVKDTFMGAEV